MRQNVQLPQAVILVGDQYPMIAANDKHRAAVWAMVFLNPEDVSECGIEPKKLSAFTTREQYYLITKLNCLRLFDTVVRQNHFPALGEV